MIGSILASLREAIVLLIADVVGILGLFSLAYFLRVGAQTAPDPLSLLAIAAVFLLTMYVLDVYGGVLRESRAKLIARTALAVLLAAGIVVTLVYVLKPLESNALYWRSVLLVGTAMFLVWAVVWRRFVAAWMRSRRSGRWLVLGTGALASCLWRDLGRKSGLG